MTRFGLDFYSFPLADVRSLGASFVCRYLSNTPSKNLTRDEADLYARHNIDVLVMWETTEGRAREGQLAGEIDAHTALTQAIQCGMVGSRPIYFTVDIDVSNDPGMIVPYFTGVRSVLGSARSGAYGGIDAIAELFDAGLISWGWQTSAWSNGRWDERAVLRQVYYGAEYDEDQAMKPDFGQWRPGVGPPHPVPPSPLAVLLPAERAAANNYEALSLHPHLHPVKFKQALAYLIKLRKLVWQTANATDPAQWDINDRRARYEELGKLTGWKNT